MVKLRFIGCGMFKDENGSLYVADIDGVVMGVDGKIYKIVRRDSDDRFFWVESM